MLPSQKENPAGRPGGVWTVQAMLISASDHFPPGGKIAVIISEGHKTARAARSVAKGRAGCAVHSHWILNSPIQGQMSMLQTAFVSQSSRIAAGCGEHITQRLVRR